ncbi:cytochrome b [Neisseria animalis]|uniref:Cytochrome b n=1 Tax=Neisseria animalis TaxID=492 RepID=A0A5P3MRF0_NEIAN|nr:cytochrome b [Neisseria animalis]QEY24162.1 cytochrome b [Neisseria animalis]ROW32232.1 cytochrome b [Neisseria animalis]VEE06413.1 putative cytochrome B561 [Neisseria animalis]
MTTPTPTAYDSISRFFHWIMALCFAIMLATAVLFFIEADIPNLMNLHKSVGSLLILLAVLRLLWAITKARRPAADNAAAKLGHLALYVLMLAVPAIALIRQYGGGRGPLKVFGIEVMQGSPEKIEWMTQLGNQWHSTLAWILFALAAGHIAMAVIHQIKGEKIMQRMIGRQ